MKGTALPLLVAAGILVVMLVALGRFSLGREAWAEMVGTLAAYAVRALFLAPFRLARWVFRLLRGIP
jgi:hypothetical protein